MRHEIRAGFIVENEGYIQDEVRGADILKEIDDIFRQSAKITLNISVPDASRLKAAGTTCGIYFKDKIRPGVLFSTNLAAIFLVRFFLEFVKTKQASYSNDFWMSTGQMLSIPFFLAGLSFIVFSVFKKVK